MLLMRTTALNWSHEKAKKLLNGMLDSVTIKAHIFFKKTEPYKGSLKTRGRPAANLKRKYCIMILPIVRARH
jgi:hypothetical protein